MDLNKYAALFLAESREHLTTCDRLLLEWEREPGASDAVAGLFRAMHSLKGMAATMGYARLADLAHHTEHLLDAIRGGRAPGGPDVVDLLLKAVDALERGVDEAAAGRTPRSMRRACRRRSRQPRRSRPRHRSRRARQRAGRERKPARRNPLADVALPAVVPIQLADLADEAGRVVRVEIRPGRAAHGRTGRTWRFGGRSSSAR